MKAIFGTLLAPIDNISLVPSLATIFQQQVPLTRTWFVLKVPTHLFSLIQNRREYLVLLSRFLKIKMEKLIDKTEKLISIKGCKEPAGRAGF